MIQLVVGAGLVLAGGVAAAAMHRSNKRAEKNGDERRAWGGEARRWPVGAALAPAALGAVVAATACFYAQDVGETVVLRNLGGSIAGHTEEAGFHLKYPWQDAIGYDTRNNLVNFYGEAEYSYEGGNAEGKQVTVNDASGAKADIDIQVNYSLDPGTAEYLYSEYGDQTTFTERYVSNDLRSVAREVAGQFDTITMLTDRAQYTRAVQDRLVAKWAEVGLTVEQVAVQDIRYPESITDAYAAAQQAEVRRQQALNEQETAKVEAETQKIQAQGEADANKVLDESLTENVIRQHYIDALKSIGENGNLIVVPEGSQPIVGDAK